MRKAFHIKKILIPTDFSETSELALEHAAFMARLMKAEIVLLHVIESFSFASSLTHVFSKTQDSYDANLEGSADEKLRAYADKLHRTMSSQVSVLTTKGKIAKTIDTIAEEQKVDLIIMGTHGSGGLNGNVAGSNAYKVAHNAPCPVLSVTGHAKKTGFSHIVMPIDNTAASRQKVPIALEFAKYYRSVIHIVGLNTLSNPEFQRKFEFKVHQVKDFIEEHEVTHTSQILKGSRLLTPLMDYATQVKADLILVMSDQEGASAQQIINQSPIPVLTMRPDEGDPDKITVGY